MFVCRMNATIFRITFLEIFVITWYILCNVSWTLHNIIYHKHSPAVFTEALIIIFCLSNSQPYYLQDK